VFLHQDLVVKEQHWPQSGGSVAQTEIFDAIVYSLTHEATNRAIHPLLVSFFFPLFFFSRQIIKRALTPLQKKINVPALIIRYFFRGNSTVSKF